MSEKELLRELAFEIAEILEYYHPKVGIEGAITFKIGDKSFTVTEGQNLLEALRNEC